MCVLCDVKENLKVLFQFEKCFVVFWQKFCCRRVCSSFSKFFLLFLVTGVVEKRKLTFPFFMYTLGSISIVSWKLKNVYFFMAQPLPLLLAFDSNSTDL